MPGLRNVNTDRKRYRIQLTGCLGSIGSDMETPAAEQPQDSPSPGRSDRGRTLALAAIVALCAGVVSGSFAGLVTWDEAATVAAGYLAAAFLAWPRFLFDRARSPWPQPWAARGCARGSSGAGGRIIGITALISGIAIAISAVAVVWGFYANANGLVMMENRLTEQG